MVTPVGSSFDWCTVTHSSNNPSSEVDRRSRLYIRFDRAFLQKFIELVNSDVTVEAFLNKQDGSQPPVEVPGYSVVGQQAKVASVRFRTGNELVLSLGDLQGTADTLRNRLREIEWFTPVPPPPGGGAQL